MMAYGNKHWHECPINHSISFLQFSIGSILFTFVVDLKQRDKLHFKPLQFGSKTSLKPEALKDCNITCSIDIRY